MNDVRNLKIALVSVFVIGAVFAGFNAFRFSQLNNRVADFNTAVSEAKTETEAKTLVSEFVSDTTVSSGALTTFAKKDEKKKKNGDCSFSLFGWCMSHYQNQSDDDDGGIGSGTSGGNYNPCFGDYSFGCNGGNPDAWMYIPASGSGSGTDSGTVRDPREFCTPTTSDGC